MKIDDIGAALAERRLPLKTAVAVWCAANGQTRQELSRMLGRGPSAVSSVLHAPQSSPGLLAELAELIGWEPTR